jgi:uncharacterized protein YndB with AHSA1/START domain
MADGDVVLRRTIAATPDRIFHAWTDADELAHWMSPVGHADAEVDLRVGGRLLVTMIGEGQRIEHHGEFLEIDAPRRLVFTWQSSHTGGVATRVTLDLAAIERGTELTLRHELLTPEAARSHASGWSSMLDRLAGLTQPGTEVSDGT